MATKIYNISIYHYANLAPIRVLGCPADFTFIFQNPKEAAWAFDHNISVAAPVPTGAISNLKTDYEYLGAYGVAASEKVGSVLLYSKSKFSELNHSNKIFLTNQSATSVLLLYILFSERKDIPVITENAYEADAVLVIGDEALTFKDKNKYDHCYDLVTLWHEAFNLPFVFARWLVRKDADVSVKETLLAWLKGLDSRDEELILKSAELEARRLNIPKNKMVQYLQGMRRKLTGSDLAGQDFFLKKAKELAGQFQSWRAKTSGHKPRLSREDDLRLLKDIPLGEVMRLGHEERMKRHPGGLVTYVMDTNPNYTNVCTVECSFCAFHKRRGDEGAYTLSASELAKRVKQAELRGASTVLLQGGLNPSIKLEQILNYIRTIKKHSPKIHIHPLSPSEIDYLGKLEGKSAEYILKTLWNEGIHTMPGGGAEILVDQVRKVISPRKCSATRWLEIMEIAHQIGYKTTATMMYGHVETPEDIVDHLLALRESQDKTGGYSSFIAWSFKPGNSLLGQKVSFPAHPAFYIRLVAVARLILDNFDHIQSSWFSESANAGCLGLMAGADDFGGVLVEESVLKTTGHGRKTTVNQVKTLIRQSGFTPARRDSNYQIMEFSKE
ncbi:CofH family radical SAM protein [Candidatus Saganbacteria bacterium]|nr:CofH family radical SAM protein [Candidatus Saganbacteria bacterium]